MNATGIKPCSVCGRVAANRRIADVCFDCARALVGLRGVSPGGTHFEPNIPEWRIDDGEPGYIVGIRLTSGRFAAAKPPPVWKFWSRRYAMP